MTDYANLRKIVTGDIIVKCKLGDEIRRIPINQEPTYDELCLMMCRVFKGRISDPEKITLKYTDDEGDLINMADDIDISHAISLSNVLKISVYDHQDANNPPHLAVNGSAEIQTTLIKMRDTINSLIDSLSIAEGSALEKKENTPLIRKLTPSEMDAFLNDTKKENAEKSSTKEQNTVTPESTTSFTPYYPPPPPQQQQKQQSIQTPQPQQQPQQNINTAQQQQQQQIKSPPTGSQPPNNAQQQIHHVPPHMQSAPPVQQLPVNHQTQPPPSTPQQYQQHVNPTFQQPQPQPQQYQGNVVPGYPNPHNPQQPQQSQQPQQPQQQRPVYYVPAPPNRNTQVGPPPPTPSYPSQW
ncbi:hypothetical protein K501DRAFT_328800 [Backusella circina FSU 941]|nr:hypothetical protein K501DRAFT_328800 [Backusella circina FSU 941]